MERQQRNRPFLVAVLSAAIGAVVMKFLGARLEIWGIALVFTINGLVLFLHHVVVENFDPCGCALSWNFDGSGDDS